MTPDLTIGMPVYNGESFIKKALNSLLEQDYINWTLIISDNCSTDNTVEIVQDFIRQDARIQLLKQPNNVGARENFITLAKCAATPYFMWAAADDEWSKNYVGSCRERLHASSEEVGFVSGNIVNTNDAGESIRAYSLFPNFESPNKFRRLSHFLLDREIDGKANLIYSVFRTCLVQEICRFPNILEGWGADMGFVAAALARRRYIQVPTAVLYKRLANQMEVANQRLVAEGRYTQIQFQGYYPLIVHVEYVQALCAGMQNRLLIYFVLLKMHRRFLMRRFKQQFDSWRLITSQWVDLLRRK